MAASAEGEGNHWPAFVDVLTAVIMVVIFLLVIMSGAVMVLSKRAIEQVRVQAQVAAAEKAVAQSAKAAAAADPTEALRAEDAIDGREALAILTRRTPSTEYVTVAATEAPEATTGRIVQTADVLIEVAFDRDAYRYGDAERDRILSVLRGRGDDGATYEIWSFSPQFAAVSEAQRLGFYRAVQTRNLLLEAGLPADRVATQVRVVDPAGGEGARVRVVVKP